MTRGGSPERWESQTHIGCNRHVPNPTVVGRVGQMSPACDNDNMHVLQSKEQLHILMRPLYERDLNECTITDLILAEHWSYESLRPYRGTDCARHCIRPIWPSRESQKGDAKKFRLDVLTGLANSHQRDRENP